MLPHDVKAFIDSQIAANTTDYSDLRAVFFNGTLKRSPQPSHTDSLIDISRHILDGVGVRTDVVRAVDHVIPPGVQPDMREDGWETDDFPQIYSDLVAPADIIVLASPIWLGDQSSMTRLIIERLYGYSGKTNDDGQWTYYGQVAGALVTGNEDGAKHCAAQMLYSLSHIGLTVPPQADSYWVGEAGPGASYGDDGTGTRNTWTTRNTVFMTWNMLHLARMLKDAGGIPAFGNDSRQWDLSDPEHPNPEYR
jgi:multimeric flavodoxin WrbA